MSYAELAVTTNYSFLRGASHPREMVAEADALGLAAIGIADRNSFAGVVRAYDEARKRKIKLLVGTRLVTIDGFEAMTYPTDREAYGRLCQLLTKGNLKAKKSECHLTFEDILGASEGQIFIVVPPLELFSSSSPVARRGIVTHSEPGTIPASKVCNTVLRPSTALSASGRVRFHRSPLRFGPRRAGPHFPRRRTLSSRR